MSEPQGSLIYLMRFLEGHLSTSESATARRRITSPDWQSAWERLQLAAVETTLPIATWEEPTVAAERLAAFLEGGLSLTEMAQVEQQCWDSPELLREFVSTYRFLHGDTPHDESLRKEALAVDARLQAIFPDASSVAEPDRAWTERRNDEPSRPGWPGIAPSTETQNDASSAPDAHLGEMPVVVTATKRINQARRHRTPAWMVYVATVVIGLGLGLGAVVIISRIRENAIRPNSDIVSPDAGQTPTPPQEIRDERDVEPRPTSRPKNEQSPFPAPQSPTPRPQRLPSPPFDIADDRPVSSDPPKPTIPPTRQPLRNPSPTVANQSPGQVEPALSVEWERIEGLLVSRDDVQQPWHGPKSDVHRNIAADYATLPDSWASAKTEHGRLVLDEDTLVHLGGSRDALHLEVERGRAAISEIPRDKNVQLQVGTKSWIIQPLEADTAIGCTVLARQSQIVVRRGRISIGGTEIGSGRQVRLSDDSVDTPSPINASTSWFTRPDKLPKLPVATRDALLASRDVDADLVKIWRTADHPARQFAARWSLAIATDQTLAQALSARDDTLRMIALDWLLTCQPDDPRILRALRMLARQTGDAQMARNVMSWLRSAQTKSRVTRADADRMVTGLRSDHLAIRQISAYFLESAFGKRVAFDPTAGPIARQQAAREWTALLNRIDRAGGGI